MNPQVLAGSALLGLSAAAAIYALRDVAMRRWDRDVEHVRARIREFTPEEKDPRPIVAAYYAYVFFVTILLFAALASKLVALILIVVFACLPWVIVARKWRERLKEIQEQLPAAIRQMASSVSAGLALPAAMGRLVDTTPKPINVEFTVINNAIAGGARLEASLKMEKERLKMLDFSILATALTTNQEMGGNIVKTLNILANALENIHRMRKEVHAATSEGRANIWVLSLAPFVMLGLITFIDAEAVGMLFTTAVGQIILGFCGLLTAGGIYWAWKIVYTDI